jgi:hypothetical protein
MFLFLFFFVAFLGWNFNTIVVGGEEGGGGEGGRRRRRRREVGGGGGLYGYRKQQTLYVNMKIKGADNQGKG